jgi:hypothetical protein
MKAIKLTQGFFATVDDGDYGWLVKYKWHVSRSAYNWYARTWIKGKAVYMHRLIACPVNGEVVNHIDGVSLNNCRSNLECVSQCENLACRKW